MRIFGLVQDSIVDGPGLRFAVFAQGCSHDCPGCHNPGSHDPRGGDEVPVGDIINQMLDNPLTDGLTLTGGEPFKQSLSSFLLARAAHSSGRNVWAYTGCTFEHLMEHGTPMQKVLLAEIDVLVDGPFVQELKTLALPWRGSSNQRLIDVPRSLAEQKVVEL